jgi:phage terminase large subunit GpA-like protein
MSNATSTASGTTTMPQRLPKLLGCQLGLAVFFAGVAAGATPPERVTVSQWAEKHRIVAAESGSPYPGKWSNARAPYLVEVMDALGFDDPCRTVTLKGSAQIAKSEAFVNFIGYTIDQHPSPFLIVLPSIEEGQKYNKTKFQPTADATPALRAKLRDPNSRDESSSTATFKRFAGGFGVITGANSSKGLQMISARVRVYEEIAEYPADVDGRGDAIEQGETRGLAWDKRGPKTGFGSTPGVRTEKDGAKVGCRISDKYDESDQRKFYVPCPHCGTFQILTPKALTIPRAAKPYGAFFACLANGCVIEEKHQAAMVAAGVWIRTYDGGAANPPPPPAFSPEEIAHWRARIADGRDPGFHIWQAYSLFVTWDTWAKRIVDAKGKPTLWKTVVQQIFGEAYEESGEAPDHERLFERREKYPPGRLLPGALFTVGATDVQGDRLEWAVYGFDRDMGQTLIDFGRIDGDPALDDVWAKHDAILLDRREDAWGRRWPVDAWGVDAGYLSQRVYRYARGHAASGKVFALDGRSGWRLPAIGSPKSVSLDFQGRKIGEVALWPVGTWDIKSEIYSALRLTLAGLDADGQWPKGAMRFHDRCDKNFFQQLTAEHIAVEPRSGVRKWEKHHERNEQHDLAVYVRALARHLTDRLSEANWANLARERLGRDGAQADLAAYWAPGLANGVRAEAEAQAVPPPERRSAPQPGAAWLPDTGDYWKGRG